MANADLTFDNIISSGSGSFKKESGFSASVKRMQTKLNRLGYDCGTADGYFGTKTETQVRAFQTAYNLTVDGHAGAKTLSKLDQLSPDSTTEKYGRELTHAQLTGGYSSSSMSETEALARLFLEKTPCIPMVSPLWLRNYTIVKTLPALLIHCLVVLRLGRESSFPQASTPL